MSIRSSLKLAVFVLPFFLLVTCAGGKVSSQPMEPEALFEKRCSRCHNLDRTNKNESVEYWTSTVKKMKKKRFGFSGISDEDVPIITKYLIETRTGAFPAQSKTEQKSK